MTGITSSRIFGLSDREKECIHHLALGLSKKEIAHILHLSPHTVTNYVRFAYEKLQAKNGIHAVVLFIIDYPELAKDIFLCAREELL